MISVAVLPCLASTEEAGYLLAMQYAKSTNHAFTEVKSLRLLKIEVLTPSFLVMDFSQKMPTLPALSSLPEWSLSGQAPSVWRTLG